MISDERGQVVSSLKDKAYRDAFVSATINSGVAFQIRANRLKRNLTQKELGQRAGMKQGFISRLEDPDSGSPNLETLIRVASAFDVALIVRFAPFSDLVTWSVGLRQESLEVSSFGDDRGLESRTNIPAPIRLFSHPSGSFSFEGR